MQGSYRARYFKVSENNEDAKVDKFLVYPNKISTFKNSNFSNKIPTENDDLNKTLISENYFRSSKNGRENKMNHIKYDDEFSTYGTSRLIKTSTIQQIPISSVNCFDNKSSRFMKEKDLRVKFSDQYIPTVNKDLKDSEEYSKIYTNENVKLEDSPSNVEVGNTFTNLFTDYVKPVNKMENYSENPVKDLDEKPNKENILKSIKKLEEKIKLLKSQLDIEYNPIETNEEIEMEIEEMEEIITKTIPIFDTFHLKPVQNSLDNSRLCRHENKLFDYDSFENERLEILEEILQENERNLKTELMILKMEQNDNREQQMIVKENVISDVNLVENNNRNEYEPFKEWFSEHNETYSIEQRNLMETIYETFQTNQTEFVKLIAQLLSKSVKSVAVQKDPVQKSDKSTFTNETNFKHVYCGEYNSINVAVIDLSTLKNISVQVNPIMINKFTCPIPKSLHDKSTSTVELIKTNSVDIGYLISVENVNTQTTKETKEEKSINYISTKQSSIEIPVRYKISEDAYGTEEIKLKLANKRIIPSPISSVNQYLTNRNENRINNLKKLISSRSEDKTGRTKLESYGIQNYRNRNNYNAIGRKRNLLRSYKQSYEPISLTDADNGHLNQFNNYMRNTILQGYMSPVINKKVIQVEKYDQNSDISNTFSNSESLFDDTIVTDELETFA